MKILNKFTLSEILGRAKHSCKAPVGKTVNQGTNASPLQTYFDFCNRSKIKALANAKTVIL